jgi:hypothetical protein
LEVLLLPATGLLHQPWTWGAGFWPGAQRHGVLSLARFCIEAQKVTELARIFTKDYIYPTGMHFPELVRLQKSKVGGVPKLSYTFNSEEQTRIIH